MPAANVHRRTLQSALAVAAALAVAVLWGSPAGAHTGLAGSTPQRGATVTAAPGAVVLQFTEPVILPQVQVMGPDGERVEEGSPVAGGASVEQSLPTALQPGTYRVAFRVASGDGHPIAGEFLFTYAGGVAVDGAAAHIDVVAHGEASGRSVSFTSHEDPDANLDASVLIVALLALLGFVGAAMIAARRRADVDESNTDEAG